MDVIVLGMGVGGEAVGGKLAEAGLEVLGIEDRLVGGECPYWGCVPSKMMIRAGNALAEARRVPRLAGTAEATPDWAPVHNRIRDEATDDWDDRVAVDRFTGKGGTFLRGRGRITGPGQVTVAGQVYEARLGIVLATGTEPAVPPIEGLAQTRYWTSRDAVAAAELPETLTILGGGAIGLELAQVFARFGVRVTIVEAAGRLLAMEEPESSALITRVLTSHGITVLTGRSAVRVREGAVTLDDGTEIRAERLLVATGRRTALSGLGLDAVGLDPQARTITVDGHMRAAERLWAVGDITGHGAFTHIAMYQAAIATRDILGEDGPAADYTALPRVTFTDPEIGAAGLTEAQAREQGVNVRTGFTELPSATRGWIHKVGNEGFVKLVADADRGVLVGATSAGPMGGEVLSALVVAVHAEVPIDRLRTMIYAYPTFHRAIEDALQKL
ncbi:dihydrolipoyl dehydrogenase family protein [Longispora albida]|uniref:dihydrolipoyl dehydrogenase family protein n=1 Tax=Longispora albida TaxID=203523 RepID=UPI00036EAC13|nr:NAD(P)/FAD-dependent oxidoreductase [Longispora albida]